MAVAGALAAFVTQQEKEGGGNASGDARNEDRRPILDDPAQDAASVADRQKRQQRVANSPPDGQRGDEFPARILQGSGRQQERKHRQRGRQKRRNRYGEKSHFSKVR